MITATISGNIGKDAETRAAGSGTVTSFSVASSAKKKGEKVTTWVRCSLWGKRGEALQRYLTKGTRIAVSGELSTREHDGKTYLELEAFGVDLLGGGERDGGERARPAPAAKREPEQRSFEDVGGGEDDGGDTSLPF